MKYYQLKFAELLGRVFPRRVAYGIARRIADVYVLLDRRGREAVMANLRRIHEHGGVRLSERALHSLARENFLNFAKYLVDFFHFLHVRPERLHRLIEFGGACEALDELLAHGRGVIVVSAHLGNWELGAAAMTSLGYKIHAVALRVPDRKLNALYQRYRAARGIHTIPFGRAARGCLEALRRNEIVALMGDRDYTGARFIVELFGAPARLPDGPAKLALATGVPVLPMYMVRRPGETFQMIVHEPIWPDSARDTLQTLTRRIAGSLERVIREHSEQWFLFHDLWDIEQDRVLATAAAFGAPQPAASSAPRA
jgi:KDO2-lipid IV(A) lauroyltransferase